MPKRKGIEEKEKGEGQGKWKWKGNGKGEGAGPERAVQTKKSAESSVGRSIALPCRQYRGRRQRGEGKGRAWE